MEEQKNDLLIPTEAEDLPQTSQLKDNRLPLDECRPGNNFKLLAFWKHNADSWIALLEAKFRMSNITTQINKCMAVLALNNSELQHLHSIPKP